MNRSIARVSGIAVIPFAAATPAPAQSRPTIAQFRYPDDTHETLLHRRWLYTFGRMQDVLKRNLRNKNVGTAAK